MRYRCYHQGDPKKLALQVLGNSYENQLSANFILVFPLSPQCCCISSPYCACSGFVFIFVLNLLIRVIRYTLVKAYMKFLSPPLQRVVEFLNAPLLRNLLDAEDDAPFHHPPHLTSFSKETTGDESVVRQ